MPTTAGQDAMRLAVKDLKIQRRVVLGIVLEKGNSMQKSSEGAMRAAREHYTLQARRIDPNDADGFEWLESEIIKLAKIIDRETGWILCSDRMPEREDTCDMLINAWDGKEVFQINFGSVLRLPEELQKVWQWAPIILPTPPEKS
ncbi:MAG TPA: hypothetical protein ENI27_07560 [bacterium]|nr:hypothetical protein [bacterium]